MQRPTTTDPRMKMVIPRAVNAAESSVPFSGIGVDVGVAGEDDVVVVVVMVEAGVEVTSGVISQQRHMTQTSPGTTVDGQKIGQSG